LTIISYVLTPLCFSLVSSDPGLTKIGIPFLRTLCFAIVGVGIHSAFKGYWAGIERTDLYMRIVIFMNCLNAFLNYILIFGHFGAPAYGPTGAAIATVVSFGAGIIINCAFAFFRLQSQGFWYQQPRSSLLIRMAKLAMPATMQEFFFSIGYVTFFAMVGQVGTRELAAANILIRVLMVLRMLGMALGISSATLVGKSIGAGDAAAAAQWGWDTGKLGIIAISVLGLPLVLFPTRFLSWFLTDSYTISIAALPLQMAAGTAGIIGLVYIFGYTLYSAGDGNRVTLVSVITQWLFFLPAVWIVGPYLHHGLLDIWAVQMAYGAIVAGLITVIWIDGRWKTVKL